MLFRQRVIDAEKQLSGKLGMTTNCQKMTNIFISKYFKIL